MRLSRRTALLLPLALGGCGMFDWLTDEAAKPIPGNREAVLPSTRGLTPDSAESVSLPDVETNADWAEPMRLPSHVGGNLAGGLNKAWSTSIGTGGDYRTWLTAQPIVAGSAVFTMDTKGLVSAHELATGRRIWATSTKPKKSRSTNLGGGIAFGGGQIFAATGLAEIVAMDASSGAIAWRKPLPAPARSAPTIVGDGLFVCTVDQRLLNVSAHTGEVQWTYQATRADMGVLAQASPAYGDGIVVAGFESGDLAAVRADTGTLVWSDNLGTLKGSASLIEFSTVRGAPVIQNGIVYGIGLGGLFAALDLRSGRRVWERDIASGNNPWLAGNVLYIISTDQRVGAVSAEDGSVYWVASLPQFTNPKHTKGLISWTGPALVGGKLVAVSSNERMAILDPVDGKVVSITGMDASGSLTPVVAQGTMLILTNDGVLTAYK